MAFSALWGNKLRTILSLLGITLGIFVMIAILTMVASLKSTVKDSISSLGDDVLYVQKWPIIFSEEYPWWKYVNRPEPTYKESKTLAERTMSAEHISFMMEFRRSLKTSETSVSSIKIRAVSASYTNIRSLTFAQGRFFSEVEAANGKNVIVLGAGLAEALFPNQSMIGQTLKINGRKLKVIGVLEKEGENFMNISPDNEAIIPVLTGTQFVDMESRYVGRSIMVKAKEGIPLDQVQDEVLGHMRSIRSIRPVEEENFAINQISMISNMLDDLFGTLFISGVVISLCSFLVGGFGIANIMFVSVKERTNQIGIQKALGAKKYFILSQFLIESVVLCIIGGLIGIILVAVIANFAGKQFDLEISLSLFNFSIGVLLSASVGILSGLFPAIQGANLDPVEAIRQ